MKWDKAVERVESLIADGFNAEVEYRIRYDRHDIKYGTVTNVSTYLYKGQKCKAINTNFDQLVEDCHTVLSVKGYK